jgi:hypothetical protein
LKLLAINLNGRLLQIFVAVIELTVGAEFWWISPAAATRYLPRCGWAILGVLLARRDTNEWSRELSRDPDQ